MEATRSELMTAELLAPEIAELIDQKRSAEVREALAELQDPELADLLWALEAKHRMLAFRFLSRDRQAAVFSFLDPEHQETLLGDLSNEQLAQILDDMAPDDRAMLFEELPGEVTAKLLTLLKPEERRRTQFLLGYPPESVGRLMTPDYLTLRPDWTIAQALDFIRLHGKDAETLYTMYVVDDRGHLLDDIKLRSLILSDPARTIRSLMDEQVVSLAATDDRERAVHAMDRYDRPVLPVVNSEGVLVGIVTFDDVADVAAEEVTEDIQKMGGVEALDDPYMSVSLWQLFRKRGTWLAMLFLGEMFTATAMNFFEGEIQQAVILALFVPLIISSGGNSGSQASTLIIRAIALGEVTLRDWLRVFTRELLCGLALGTLLGVIGLLRIHVWHWLGWADYTDHYHLVGLTVAVSLLGVVVWGTLMGSMLPFLLRFLRLDPATISAPLVATLVDVTGLVIYFTTAMALLRGTLL